MCIPPDEEGTGSDGAITLEEEGTQGKAEADREEDRAVTDTAPGTWVRGPVDPVSPWSRGPVVP